MRAAAAALAVFLPLLLAPLAAAYKEADELDSTLSTHQYIMDFLPGILERDGHPELAAKLRAGWLDRLKWGSIESDRYLWRQGNHYMSPVTHEGLAGFASAGDYADAQFANAQVRWAVGDEAGAMLRVGWAMHAVEDLTEPHHARLDPFHDHGAYEEWVLAHQTELPAATSGIYSYTAEPSHDGNVSRPWDWVDYAAHQSYDLYPYIAGPDGAPGIDWRAVASQMVPLAEALSAGFFYRMVENLDAGPPIADPGPDVTVYVGDSVPLDGGDSTDDVAIHAYEWRLPGNGTFPGPTFSFVPSAPGDSRVELAVTDAFGKTGIASVTVTAVPLPPGGRDEAPVAVIDAPAQVAPGDDVVFDGRGSTDDLGIARYAWDFGDGTSARTASASHAYLTEGTYTVTLKVWDGAGNRNESTAKIQVVAAPPPSKAPELIAFVLLAVVVAAGIAGAVRYGRRRRRFEERREDGGEGGT